MFDNETNVLQVLRSSPGHTFASTLYVSAACMAEDAATPAQLLDAVTAWAHGALRDDSGDESGDDDSAPPTFTANATCAECTTVRPVGSPRVTVCLTARVPLGQEPPCALVVVDRLPRGAAVELEVVAAAHNRAATMLTKRWSPAEGVCCWPQCACMCPPYRAVSLPHVCPPGVDATHMAPVSVQGTWTPHFMGCWLATAHAAASPAQGTEEALAQGLVSSLAAAMDDASWSPARVIRVRAFFGPGWRGDAHPVDIHRARAGTSPTHRARVAHARCIRLTQQRGWGRSACSAPRRMEVHVSGARRCHGAKFDLRSGRRLGAGCSCGV